MSLHHATRSILECLNRFQIEIETSAATRSMHSFARYRRVVRIVWTLLILATATGHRPDAHFLSPSHTFAISQSACVHSFVLADEPCALGPNFTVVCRSPPDSTRPISSSDHHLTHFHVKLIIYFFFLVFGLPFFGTSATIRLPQFTIICLWSQFFGEVFSLFWRMLSSSLRDYTISVILNRFSVKMDLKFVVRCQLQL